MVLLFFFFREKSMRELFEREISNIYIDKDKQEAIKFKVSSSWPDHGKEFTYLTDGDCCSETWFADIIGLNNLRNSTVTGIEIINMPSVDDGRTRQEYDEIYAYKLMTKEGVCEIIFRNSSNGYYGGSVYLDKDNETKEYNFVEIEGDDWSA